METTRPTYGDLTEKEYYDLLEEIKSGDEDMQEAHAEAEEKIVTEEVQTALVELPENAELETYYGEDAWRKLNSVNTFLFGDEGQRKASLASAKAGRARFAKLKDDRIRIQRMAFNQEDIRLSDYMGNENIKLVVSLLVKEHTRMIDKYQAYINRRIASLLNPFIPRRLRLCKALYPDSVKPCPGFMYKASEEHGGGLSIWVTPGMPYYFAQGTEQEMLKTNKPEFLFSIDRAVLFYHEHLKKRTEKELRYASLILQKGTYSYFDLLRLNPFWFELLYNHLTGKDIN